MILTGRPSSLLALVLSLLVVGTLLAPVAGAAPRDGDAAPRYGTTRRAPAKPEHANVGKGYSRERLHLKFVEGTTVRLRGNRFVSESGDDDLSGLQEVLRRYPGVQPQRLFERPERELARDKARVEAQSGRQQADFNLYYRLRLRPRTATEALIDDLNGLGIVEIAYAEPLPMPAPSSHTPDFSGGQDYAEVAPGGVDALAARAVPGGRGGNVQVIDIEYSWNQTHEDLSKAATGLIANKTPSDPFSSNDHGTAVIGELVADDNGFGVTGLAPDAALGMVNANNSEDGYDLADAIDVARAASSPGDVILLEQQIAGPNGCNNGSSGCVAVEWVQAYYDAIVAATSAGIIVVEAAGNGNENLDDTATYGSPFPSGRADSGAIIVGSAGNDGCVNPARAKRPSSTFGSRVNLQGWGECVTTTGYGALQGSSQSNDAYTNAFNGTSSASPIVAAAAGILSSIAQQQGDADGLSSTEVRSRLVATGTAQNTDPGTLVGNIGPQPNLAQAILDYVPVADVGGPYTTTEGLDVALDASASSDPQGQPLTYAWDLDNDGVFADATGPTPTFTDVGRDGVSTVAVQVTDSAGAQATASTTVTVSNAAPAVTLDTALPQDEGTQVTVTGSGIDAGWLDPLSATIDWQDGSPVQAVAGTLEQNPPDAELHFAVGHVYGDNGVYPVEVCVSDDDTTTCDTVDVTIGNVDPSVAVDPAQTLAIDEGEELSFLARFSDPGWLDDYSSTIDWGTGESEPGTLTVDVTGPPADFGGVAGTHQYGDNGEFLVSATVGDDDGGSGDAGVTVTVNNVDPTAAIDTSGATTINGSPVFLGHAGNELTFSAASQDPGSDDLTLTWNWDDGTAPTQTSSLAAPPLADLLPSPTVNARNVSDTQAHTFGSACLYDLGFASADDDGGDASDSASVVITGNADRNRSAGYWQTQYRGLGTREFDAATLNCYLAISGHLSVVFDEVRDASTQEAAAGVLKLRGSATVREQLERQLLAALLNFANGGSDYADLVDTDGDGVGDTTFADMVTAAEAALLDPAATTSTLEAHKDTLERFNKRDG